MRYRIISYLRIARNNVGNKEFFNELFNVRMRKNYEGGDEELLTSSKVIRWRHRQGFDINKRIFQLFNVTLEIGNDIHETRSVFEASW